MNRRGHFSIPGTCILAVLMLLVLVGPIVAPYAFLYEISIVAAVIAEVLWLAFFGRLYYQWALKQTLAVAASPIIIYALLVGIAILLGRMN